MNKKERTVLKRRSFLSAKRLPGILCAYFKKNFILSLGSCARIEESKRTEEG
jgi:hypothetical protein